MHDQTREKQKNGVSPVVAGMTGVLVGAASVAAIALSDKATREKAARKAKQMKGDLAQWGNEKVHQIRVKGKKAVDQASDEVDTANDKARKLNQDIAGMGR